MPMKAILDDGDLWLGAGPKVKSNPAEVAQPSPKMQQRVRFRQAYASELRLPDGAVGTVVDCFVDQDGTERMNVLLDGMFAMGVPADQVETL